MTDTIHDVLAELRDAARNNRDLGNSFERLIQSFLTKDLRYADLFSNVWLWMEWPGRANKGDTGIDLVAEERATADLWAIQAKFLPSRTHT
jgi:predicted helicase